MASARRHRGRRPGLIPVYSVRIERTTRARARDPKDPSEGRPKRTKGERVPIYRVVLRKERTIRVAETHAHNAASAANIAHAIIGDSPYEKMLVLLVNMAGRVVGAVVIATSSSVSSSAVHIRGVFSAAIAHNASAVILAHNHPSGRTDPSEEDQRFANVAERASSIMNIPILDHLIVTPNPSQWSSFKA